MNDPTSDDDAGPPTTTAKGRAAEDRAVLLLEREGYEILERNVRAGRNEIDIIARDGDYLVFIEVRSREDMLAAANSVDGKKRHHVITGARHYLADLQRRDIAGGGAGRLPLCRFDVVLVDAGKGEVLKNAFEGRP